jgi:hypothetical protein
LARESESSRLSCGFRVRFPGDSLGETLVVSHQQLKQDWQAGVPSLVAVMS